MTRADLELLRPVAVSAGLMLESVAERLCDPGGPHYGCPDKHPRVRLETIRTAGELCVPFTSGILIGIGETRRERIESLLALRALHARYDHLQEIIVQNFRAKPGTAMADAAEPSLAEHLWTIAIARLVFAPAMSIQAPPNLNAAALDRLLAAGINDWGGVSPVTPDHVNPEAPWPHLNALRRATEAAGKELVARLPIYPRFVQEPERWLARSMRAAVLDRSDAEGYARENGWIAGAGSPPELAAAMAAPALRPAGELQRILHPARDGQPLGEADIVRLFAARGREAEAVCRQADELRAEVNGARVSYVVNRNINYTNVCYFHCRFCAFSKGKLAEDLRGVPYEVDLEEIARRTREAWQRGATEICLQGGIHPDYTGQTYLDICRTVKAAAPGIHVHAFSPLEVWQGAHTLGLPLREFLAELRGAGLGSLPGTAAEILDDEVRSVICPDKIDTAQWLEVMRCAHERGLAQHRDRDVRSRRPPAPLGQAPAARPRAAGRNRRLHRVRAAAVRAHGGADLPQGRRPQGSDLARGAPDARDRASRAAPAHHQRADIVGEDGAARGPGVPGRRRQRSRRHADERVDHPRRRRGLWSGAAATAHASADRRHRPRARSAYDPLWRSSGRARGGIVLRGASGGGGHPAAAPPRARQGAPARALRLEFVPTADNAITLTAIPGIPAIRAGDDLARILGDALEAAALPPREGDVLVVTHKIVSKAEGRYVTLADVTPSRRARELAGATDKDPALVEVILSESREILRFRPGLIIAEHRLGVVIANAGVDHSNVPGAEEGERVLLLPQDPDASSAVLRDALQERFGVGFAVVVSDSVGRAWRNGIVGLALGAAGLPALLDLRGRPDLEGRPLMVTQVGLADEIASAAQLLMGEADEGRPAVLVRGLAWDGPPLPASALLRDPELDLFR